MFGGWQDHFLLLLLAPYTLCMAQKIAKVGDMWLTAQQVPRTLWDEFGFQEGSVLNEEGVAKSPGQKLERLRWPGGVLKFELSNAVKSEHRNIIRSTLGELQKKLDSCIEFREIDHGFRVIVEMGNECNSYVGRMFGPDFMESQSIELAEGCAADPSSIEHEFLHALGVEHTQERTDRDRYVKINEENIKEELKFNFLKLSEAEVSEFGLPYDFHSVMHYGPYAFSKNGKRTIETLDPSKQDIIGKAKGVSEGDVLLLKRMYKCNYSKEGHHCKES